MNVSSDEGSTGGSPQDAWAARHPEVAKAERTLRQQNRAAIKNFGHKVNGTVQTHAHAARTHQGAVARLYMAGDIDAAQLAAAEAIRTMHGRITRDVAIGTASLETRVDRTPRFDGVFFEKLGLVRAEVTYSHWRREIEEPAMVLAIVIDDTGVAAAARRAGMRNAKAKRLLIRALDHWLDCNDDAVRHVDHATLAAAQSGIL